MSAERERARDALRRAAVGYRLGTEASASVALAELVGCLERALVGSEGLGLCPERLASVLAAILAAQERRDPIEIADRLEHELAPLLG